MNDQLQVLHRLRRDQRRFCVAVEAIWAHISKKVSHGTAEHLSLNFLMQHDGLDCGMITAITYSSNAQYATHLSYALQCYRITLTDARVLMLPQSDGTYDLAVNLCEVLVGNPYITRDLYDYLSARGHNCHYLAHLAHDLMRLTHSGYRWLSSIDITTAIGRGLWAPTTYTRLTLAQCKHLRAHKLTYEYLMMSATTPQELWTCEKTRHLMKWEYLEQYFANPLFSITHKLQTWSWVETLPAEMLGTCSRPYVVLSDDELFTYRPQLLDVIYMMCKHISWIDYVDFNALLAISGHNVMARACRDVLVIDAPVAWWKTQQPLTSVQKIQIAIERDLPGALDELIRQLPSKNGAESIDDLMRLYRTIRQCHIQRLVKAVARHWLAKVR